jgi:hypothetical protein
MTDESMPRQAGEEPDDETPLTPLSEDALADLAPDESEQHGVTGGVASPKIRAGWVE